MVYNVAVSNSANLIMIGLIIVTHEPLADAYRKLAVHFFPDEDMTGTVWYDVAPSEGHEPVIKRVVREIDRLAVWDGLLLLTDIFGATPCNAVCRLVQEGRVAVLTGLNVPMLVKAVQYHRQADDVLVFTAKVKQAAEDGILTVQHPSD